jgi:sugar lactone lactonase YvrE
MFLRICQLFSIILITNVCLAQKKYELTHTFGSLNLGGINEVTADKDGNLYVVSNVGQTRLQKLTKNGDLLIQKYGKSDTYLGEEAFKTIKNLTVDKNGNLYFFDGTSVVKYDSSFNLLMRYGSIGTDIGQYLNPSGLAVSNDGNVYVTSVSNNGVFIAKYNDKGEYKFKFGKSGSNPGEFSSIGEIILDKDENLYVINGGSQIQKFDKNGNYILVFETPSGNIIRSLYEIAIDSAQVIYVSGPNDGIFKFSQQGKFMSRFLNYGTYYGVESGIDGNIYVKNNTNFQRDYYTSFPIYKYDAMGTLIKSYGLAGDEIDFIDVAMDSREDVYIPMYQKSLRSFLIKRYDKYGNFKKRYKLGVGRRKDSKRLAMDKQDNIYICDNYSINKYKNDGTFLKTFGGTFGAGDGKFAGVKDVSIDNDGKLYGVDIYDNFNNGYRRINKFDSIGSFIDVYRGLNYNVTSPYFVETDNDNNVVLYDTYDSKIKKFDKLGNILLEFKPYEQIPDLYLTDIALDMLGNIYLTDINNHQICVFDNTGKLINKITHPKLFRPTFISVNKAGTRIVVCEEWLDVVFVLSSEVELNKGNTVSGKIFHDKNENCKQDKDEPGIPNISLVTLPNEYYTVSDNEGNYKFILDTGSYTIRQISVNVKGKSIQSFCPEYKVNFSSFSNTLTEKDFGNQVSYNPFLTTYVSSSVRRRCFVNRTRIDYSNSGFAKSENAKVYVKLPEYVIFKSADKTFTRDKEGNYVFDVGILEPNQSGTINILDSVACERNITGLTQCTKAWITPSNQREINPSWDKSDIFLSGKCQDNGFVRMGVYNRGNGNMKDSLEYRIYINAQLSLKKKFKLNLNDSLIFRIPANGRTIRLEADEPKEHPSKVSTNVTIENCGTSPNTPPSLGYVTKFPQDDSEPEVSISCLPIVDSYDPNDKQVEPVGTTANHYTPTDAELKYLIRFQNTGTDTTYTVTVIDTLSENLDIATLQLGGSSHKYSFNLSGKGKPVLTWTFNKINLPDSTKNSLASNGFVAFSIKPKTGLSEKTRIENYADIIFDFNDPVRTNTTFNTIYDVPPVVESSVKLDEKTVIIPKPVITSFSPAKAKIGETITLKGNYFNNTLTNNIVKINSLKVVLDSGNDSTLVFKVPTGATTGKISVENMAGSIVSTADLVILFPPVISSFSPQTGVPGDKVTISGSNFEEDKTKNTVKFGTVPAEVISSTATTIEVKVPGGFVNEKISVSTTIGNAVSASSFTMSPNAVEFINSENISIFPNPTDGKVVISFGERGLTVQDIRVQNMLGLNVINKNINKLILTEELNLEHKNAGVYLIIIKLQNATITKKLVLR